MRTNLGRTVGLFLTLIGSSEVWATSPQILSKPNARNREIRVDRSAELTPDLVRDLCSIQDGLPMHLVFWGRGVFDAQVEGMRFRTAGAVAVDADQARARAQALASGLNYRGYGGAVCPDGSAVAVAFPSPIKIEFDQGLARIPVAALKENCRDYRADFVGREGGKSRFVPLTSGDVKIADFAAGMLSVSCTPRVPRWMGPVTWYAVPTQQGPAQIVPEVQLLDLAGSELAGLRAWIAAMRRRENLAAVTFDDAALERAAKSLAAGGSLAHNRRMMKSEAAKALPSGFVLLGENRVRAATLRELAWLLWNSPRHRDLLIDGSATHLGLHVQRGDGRGSDGVFAVLISASAVRPSTANTGAPKPRG